MRSLAIVVIAGALLFGAREVLAEPAYAKRLPKNYSLWIKIGRCEQPGRQWPGNIYWSHPGPTYGGGLGIYQGTWAHWKVKGMPSRPGLATWRQQMWVANRIAADVGLSAWDCWARVR